MSQNASQAKDELGCYQEREIMQRRQQEAVFKALRDKQLQLENDCDFWKEKCEKLESQEMEKGRREDAAEQKIKEIEMEVQKLKK